MIRSRPRMASVLVLVSLVVVMAAALASSSGRAEEQEGARADPAAALASIKTLLARKASVPDAESPASRMATQLLREIISGDLHNLTPEHHDVVAEVLDLGIADMTSPSRWNGDTLLHSAVRRGDLTLVRMLLLAGAE